MKHLYMHRTYRPFVMLMVIALLVTAFMSVQAQTTNNEPDECEPFKPLGWTEYTVQQGDTLSGITLEHDAIMAQIQYVNCLQTRAQIQIGQTLYVPVRKNNDQEPFNFALQCHNEGYDAEDCVRMMNMLGEENGNTLRVRCREEGLDVTTCRWLQTMAQEEEAGNGLMTRCHNDGFDADMCYRMMLTVGQDDADDILETCTGTDADKPACQWMMTHMYRYRHSDQDDVDPTDADQVGDQTRDRDRDQDHDQDCDQDCDHDQDRDREQNHDGDGNGNGGDGGNPPDNGGKGKGK